MSRPGTLDHFEAEMRSRRTATAEQKSTFEAWREQRAAQTDALSQTTHDRDDLMQQARAAAERLLAGHSYEDWMTVGGALQILVGEAKHNAGTNTTEGKRYAKEIHRLLDEAGLGVILKDRAVRSRLLHLVEHHEEVRQFRAGLKPRKLLELNHPNAVWRAWKTEQPDPDKPKPERKPTLREAHAAVLEENHRLKQEIARGGGDLWNRGDRPEEIAKVMVGNLSATKAEKVARAMLKLLAAAKKEAGQVVSEDESRGA
jgi:hypothetical protein